MSPKQSSKHVIWTEVVGLGIITTTGSVEMILMRCNRQMCMFFAMMCSIEMFLERGTTSRMSHHSEHLYSVSILAVLSDLGWRWSEPTKVLVCPAQPVSVSQLSSSSFSMTSTVTANDMMLQIHTPALVVEYRMSKSWDGWWSMPNW